MRAVLRQNLLFVKRPACESNFQVDHVGESLSVLTGLMQFDEAEGHDERLNDHCGRMLIPSDLLSLDETLYPYRGRIGIKQYNPNKLAKYDLLYCSISDAERPYTYNTLPYAGKPNVITPQSEYVTGTDNYTKYLVKGLEVGQLIIMIDAQSVQISTLTSNLEVGLAR